MKRIVITFVTVVILMAVMLELIAYFIEPKYSPDIDQKLSDLIKQDTVLSRQMGTFHASNVDYFNAMNYETDTLVFKSIFSGSNGNLFLNGNAKLINEEWVILNLYMLKNNNDSISIIRNKASQ